MKDKTKKEKPKNPCGKRRPIERPYEVWKNNQGWEWRVLKKYQSPEKELENPYARWHCAVKSPFTFGSYEYGDVYKREIEKTATCISTSY